MIASNRITIYEQPDMQIDLEYTEHYAILHLPRLKLTKTTYLDFIAKVQDLYGFITTAGYEAIWTAIDPTDTVTAKLLDRIGANKLGSSDGLDVYEYRGAN